MFFFLSLFISFRFSRSRRFNGMVSLVSLISIISIMLGVMVLIVGLSAMNGFERELNNRILAVIPHGEIEPINHPMIHNWQFIINKIEYLPDVSAAAPYINFTGLINNGKKLYPLQIKGIEPQKEYILSNLANFVTSDSWSKFISHKSQIIVGQGIIKDLNLHQGDWISIMIPNVYSGSKLGPSKYINLQISGVLKLGGILDHHLALVQLNDAQHYLKMGNSVNGIAFKIHHPFMASKIIHNLSHVIDSDMYINSWVEKYGYIYRDIKMIRTILYLAMILVIAVSCFNIVSMLIMAVKDKTKDIAILQTLGADDILIRNIFIWYGLLTSFLGSFIGMILGVLLSINLTYVFSKIEKIIGHHIITGDIYFIDFLPSELHGIDLFFTLLTVIILSLFASWYPAKKATYIDPVRVLSGH